LHSYGGEDGRSTAARLLGCASPFGVPLGGVVLFEEVVLFGEVMLLVVLFEVLLVVPLVVPLVVLLVVLLVVPFEEAVPVRDVVAIVLKRDDAFIKVGEQCDVIEKENLC
jgi:hypothetical protein